MYRDKHDRHVFPPPSDAAPRPCAPPSFFTGGVFGYVPAGQLACIVTIPFLSAQLVFACLWLSWARSKEKGQKELEERIEIQNTPCLLGWTQAAMCSEQPFIELSET